MALHKLNVVLCWHMHQPYYREGKAGEFHLPWVYLHGIKDYTDMAKHLEHHPQMSVVVNFSPVLLEQLDIYVQELASYLKPEGEITLSDPLLALLAGAASIPDDVRGRKQIFDDCSRCFAPRMIAPYPAFHRLMQCLEEAVAHSGEDGEYPLMYLDEQYFLDVLVWYHLVWLGHSLRDNDMVQHLIAKEHGYTLADRLQLLVIIYEALASIIPRYRALADSGQVELSFTPYAHPIVPLMHSFDNMGCAQSEAPRPQCEDYPKGAARTRWHMQKGIDIFSQHFGRKPEGVWLSEGGISADAIELLDEMKLKWTASGEHVWRNTCHLVGYQGEEVDNKKALFRPYQYQALSPHMYFRDDGLSDFIGFEYSHWNAEDAAKNFVENLSNISNFLGDDADQHVVSIVLDGENAWEYYLDNGYHFLDALYREMSQCEAIKTTTFSQTASTVNAAKFEQLCAGSWVYGSFSTWIGQDDKNRAWEYLVAAKKSCDAVVSEGVLSTAQLGELDEQLAICEGSDWFWWFGDYNPSGSVNDFDALFRVQLKKLYALIGQNAPEYLDHPVSTSMGADSSENAGTMRRNA